ncbi:MAG: hypothetical protein NTU78_16295, partial [Alphaproteobacteria bacterium]|nr:hypothetical protein [Alphaproteobacteria bacterium]
MNKNQSQPASDALTRADDEPVSDFVLQKSARRGCIYHEGPGIRYSEELKKWVVTSPELIRQAMYDDAFSVHTYDVSPLIDKLGVDLHCLNELCKQFPLATEGERHRPLREKFARHVAAQTRGALDVLTAEVDTRLSILARKPDGAPFCLHEELLKPALRKTVLSLAGIDPTLDVPIEDMPQLFDCFLPVSRHVRINTLIRDILGRLPGELSLEDKYFRIAVVALASNTTLSSVSLTIADRLRAAEGTPLKDIDWGSDFVRTGLPLIEKWAVKD